MPCSDSARLLRPHLMLQAGWLLPEGLRLWDTWQRRTCHLVGSGPGGRCPQLSGPGFCAQLPRGLVRGYG